MHSLSGVLATMLKKGLLGGGKDANGPTGAIMIADIRSTDGKYHRMIFDRSRKFIKFTITG